MNENHKELMSILLSVSVVALALYIIHRFIPSIVWAGIITIATYPLYQKWCLFFGKRKSLAAFLFTIVLAILIIAPLSWMISVLIRELQVFVSFLQSTNAHGSDLPDFMADFPWFTNEIQSYWNEFLGQPGNVKDLLSNLHFSLAPLSHYVKQVSFNIFHRGFQIGFTLMSLFFFYRDGETLTKTIHRIGENCLGVRWYRYAEKLPSALRGTVNGTIFVGVGVGFLMGICYAFVHCPGPAVLGFITACAAMIPFVVPLVIVVVASIVWIKGSILGALIVMIWGTIVVFIADHFIKPALIGGAIKLPFLVVLFGILGGVETLGLLGLFIGPIVMVLFLTLWQETDPSTENLSDKRYSYS
jgi:predicted PurR-regulated permease PerM